MSDSASRFDIIERLLNHGLHPVVEAVLFMLSVEDICQFESVCRYLNSIHKIPVSSNNVFLLDCGIPWSTRGTGSVKEK